MGDVIVNNIEWCLMKYFPTFKIITNLVWEPKWTSDFITPAGKKELNSH
jgi:metal-sulfur cluster biosynthetic enzyme